ncbi:MAG TPA: hypothetical protein VLD35_06625 [Caldimonas sp.]|nr:hypothetical protein [Caldimonas sp.]
MKAINAVRAPVGVILLAAGVPSTHAEGQHRPCAQHGSPAESDERPADAAAERRRP